MLGNLLRKDKKPVVSSAFVTRNGAKLELDGSDFRFSCLNAPELLDCDTTGTFEIRDTMDTLGKENAFFYPVSRTYTLRIKSKNIGKGHINGWTGSDWDWNEGQLQEIDQVLDEAAKRNVRLIIPIINEDTGPNSNWVGNYTDLIAMKHGWSYDQARSSGIDWWTDAEMWDAFKLILDKLVDRVNTKNGRRYGDDPAILAWETGNEMNYRGNQPAPASWTIKVAQYIKSKAPNALVMDGSFARTDVVKASYREEVLKCPEVDIFSYHYYGSGDIDRVAEDARYVQSYKKVFVAGEFGFFSSLSDYKRFLSYLSGAKGTGALVWSLRPHSAQGGFKTHGEGNGIFSYHAPGFRTDDDRFDAQERGVMDVIRKYSFTMLNAKVPAYPVPDPPRKLWIDQGVVRWFGSAWAKEYELKFVGSDGRPHTRKVTDCHHEGRPHCRLASREASIVQAGNCAVAIAAISDDGVKSGFSDELKL